MRFFVHDAGQAEAQAMYDAVMSGDLTTGRITKQFEQRLCDVFGFPKVAIANSGTSALHLALITAGVGPGDEVITTPFVGVWTSNPILMVGATPVYADVNAKTYNLDPYEVTRRVTPKTKAVMPVSVNGVPFDYQTMRETLDPKITIIGDDIEALGSMRNGQYVGADLQANDMSVNGFWVSKQVTTCSGGMMTSPNLDLVDKFASLTRHGHGVVGDMWDQAFGYNMWLPDPLAAMGIVQIDRMAEKQDRLLKVRAMMDHGLGHPRRQMCPMNFRDTEFVYIIELPFGMSKKKYSIEMAKMKIPTRPYFNDLTKVPHLSHYSKDCPAASALSERTVALPYHWKMTEQDVQSIAYAHAQALEVLA